MTPPSLSVPPVQWAQLARHGLITMVFCCLIAAAITVSTGRSWDSQLVYSLAIGMTTWATIDLFRMVIWRREQVFWPSGLRGMLLAPVAIVIGFVVGTTGGDLYVGVGTLQGIKVTQREMLTSLTITVAAGSAASYFFYSVGKDRALKARLALIERDAAEARLKLLETQLEPHMLFNTLANLRALIHTDPPRAVEMLDRLNDYLRATLSGSRVSFHSLQAEFDRLNDYLALMSVRMGQRLSYELELPEALRECPVPPLLLQPVVENSIKHGLEPKVEGGRIRVTARQDMGNLVLELSDTGIGMSGPAAPAGGGFGLTQVRERLLSAYGGQAALTFTGQTGDGTCTVIHLPMQGPSS